MTYEGSKFRNTLAAVACAILLGSACLAGAVAPAHAASASAEVSAHLPR